jgi:hypothetical protein
MSLSISSGPLQTVTWKGSGWQVPGPLQRAYTIPLTGLIKFNQLLSRRTKHVHKPSLIGRWTSTGNTVLVIPGPQSQAFPWMAMHTCTSPPSAHHHPLWSAAVDMEKDAQGKKTKCPLYSHRTTSTTLQLTVDHAFTGSYAQWFCPVDPPKTLTCPCRAPLRTPQHITRECPLFYQTHVNHTIHTHGCTIPYSTLYNSHPHKLLLFIQDSRAASHPPEFGPPWEIPPEPD